MMTDDVQVEDWISNLDGGGAVPSSLHPYRLGGSFPIRLEPRIFAPGVPNAEREICFLCGPNVSS